MYKMLIAEQDEGQIELLKSYTRNVLKEVEIVKIEKNGVSVLNYIKEHSLDILVISVSLEGISGLEVVRRVRQFNSRLHIVMISAYDYSDFVIEAFNYGVKDYLLKPVKESEYSAVLLKIKDELNQIKQVKEKKTELERRKDQIDVFADYSFIYSILWNNGSTQLLKMYKEFFGIDKYGYILNIEYVRTGEECVLDLDKDFKIIYQGIKDAVSVCSPCVVGPEMGKRIIVFVCQTEEQAMNVDNETSAIATANMLRFEMLRCFDIEVKIGIGSLKKIEDIRDSYEEAIKSLRYMDGYDVIHIRDVVSNSVSHKNYIDLETKFLQNTKFGKEECIEQYVQILDVLQPLSIAEIKNKLLELIVMACHEVRAQCENEVSNLNYMAFLGEIQELDWEGLKDWGYSKIEYIIKSVRASRGARKSAVIKEALEYVNYNFKEDLTLEVIAKYVGVTPQHFSKIFKEETKFTYVEWLTNIRIEKAKEYLLEGTRTIKEIGFAVGFHDPNYFSRIFKKTVGKSPTAYAKPERNPVSSN